MFTRRTDHATLQGRHARNCAISVPLAGHGAASAGLCRRVRRAAADAPGDAPGVSNPFSIGLSFTEHPETYVQDPCGTVRKRSVAAGSGGILGGEPVAWVRVDEPFACLEFDLSSALHREVAEELKAPAAGLPRWRQ